MLLAALPKAVGLALEEQDVDVVGQAIEQGCGQGGVGEDLPPARELQVAGDQDAPPLVALGTALSILRGSFLVTSNHRIADVGVPVGGRGSRCSS